MAINEKLQITELDFDNIKTNLKHYLSVQTDFQDYNFEGSGINIILDLMAYNTHYLAFYLNMLASEMFLDSSAIRDSVVSHAKSIGYLTRSSRSSKALVAPDLILVTPDGGSQDTAKNFTIPKFTKFISAPDSNGKTYIFYSFCISFGISKAYIFKFYVSVFNF